MFAVVDDDQLADRYQLPLIKLADSKNYDAWLVRKNDVLYLDQNYLPDLNPLSLDFSKGKSANRLKQSQHVREPLGRACGLSKGRRPAITDATAGLAQDGVLLAALGAEVTLLEQHPLLHALIDDALARAKSGPVWLQQIIDRVDLQFANSTDWLTQNHNQVIYLDPMYPEPDSVRYAQVKKPMQILRSLSGTSTNASQLFEIALAAAEQRLVVKRPDWAQALSEQKPSERLDTKTHHFDIYLKH